VSGSMKDLNDATGKGLGNRFEALRRKYMGKLADFAEAVVIPALEGVTSGLENIGTAVEETGEFVEKWSPVIAGIAVFLAVINAPAIGAAVSLGILQVAIWGLTAAETAGAIAGGALAAVIAVLESPFLLIGAAIAAVVAALVVLWLKSDKFRAWVKTAWSDMGDWLKTAAQDIGNFFNDLFVGVLNAIITKINGVIRLINHVIDMANKVNPGKDIGLIGEIGYIPTGDGGKPGFVEADASLYGPGTTTLHGAKVDGQPASIRGGTSGSRPNAKRREVVPNPFLGAPAPVNAGPAADTIIPLQLNIDGEPVTKSVYRHATKKKSTR